jgi:hypothetical protein
MRDQIDLPILTPDRADAKEKKVNLCDEDSEHMEL